MGGPLAEVSVERKNTDQPAAPSSLERLYRANATLLFRYALALLESEADAEDALHTVFLRLASKGMLEMGDGRGYLLRAVRNECRTRRRRRRRLKTLPLVEGIPGQSADNAQEINRALTKLAPKLRETVLLRIYEDMTFEDIAGALGVSATTARERYTQALDRLRKLLEA